MDIATAGHTTLDQGIEAALAATGEPFTPTRYPFTYAYDFFRCHAAQMPATPVGAANASRSESSAHVAEYARNLGLPRFEVIVALADAYLTEFNVRVTDEEKEHALAWQRHVHWRSCGLDAPGPEVEPPA